MREGPRRPRELKVLAEDAGAILLRNVYGWFARKERGLYTLTPVGRGVLDVAEPGEQEAA